jgi:hypothetical protein
MLRRNQRTPRSLPDIWHHFSADANDLPRIRSHAALVRGETVKRVNIKSSRCRALVRCALDTILQSIQTALAILSVAVIGRPAPRGTLMLQRMQ